MTLVYPDISGSEWQPLHGIIPSAVIDTHPSGKYVAMQVLSLEEDGSEKAAIWNTETKKIAWNPANANAICWIENGTELLVLETQYNKEAFHNPLYASPTQSEYKHFIKRVTWPALDLIACLQLKLPHGWLIDIAASPAEKTACVVWQDQCESGFEFVYWKENTLYQPPYGGLYEKSNLIRGPVFSPQGSVVAATFGLGTWWAETPDQPSERGQFRVGYIVWSEVGSSQYFRKDVLVNVPEGWKPKYPQDVIKSECLSLPEFLSENEIKIVLPAEEEILIPLY